VDRILKGADVGDLRGTADEVRARGQRAHGEGPAPRAAAVAAATRRPLDPVSTWPSSVLPLASEASAAAGQGPERGRPGIRRRRGAHRRRRVAGVERRGHAVPIYPRSAEEARIGSCLQRDEPSFGARPSVSVPSAADT
jgi:hypothetical protein